MKKFASRTILGLVLVAIAGLPVRAAAEEPPQAPVAIACQGELAPADLDELLVEPLETPAPGTPKPKKATCSGEDCGCYDPPCEQQCPGGSSNWQCMAACTRAQVQCAIWCCAD